MADDQALINNRRLLLDAVQYVGFDLTSEQPGSLSVVTLIEEALIRDDWEPLRVFMYGDHRIPKTDQET